MRMLRWISGNTNKDRIQNEEIHLKIWVTLIDEKMRDNRLRWFCDFVICKEKQLMHW